MPYQDYEFSYRYHAVGQGLFASGCLVPRNGPRHFPPFRWVYDCGTSSKQNLIDRGLGDLPWLKWGIPVLDDRIELVTISHFDMDHISGLARLLQRHRIDTLLLPYMPLWSRLVLAFEQRADPSQKVFRLFLDPVGYVRALGEGDRIGRIVMVPPAGDETPPEPPDAPVPPETPEGPFELKIEDQELDEATANDLLLGSADRGVVTMLRPGGRILLQSLWEFIPYNDAAMHPREPAAFVQAVSDKRDVLMARAADWLANRTRGDGGEERIQQAVDDLRQVYDDEFGDDPGPRNMISLFLYSGPLSRNGPTEYSAYDVGRVFRQFGRRIAQLFSGDGYLNEPARMDALERYLGRNRTNEIGFFQVMHHGARGNWYEGVAARIAPDISIFSSNPNDGRYLHPDADVLRDFWPFGAVQVDLETGLSVRGELGR